MKHIDAIIAGSNSPIVISKIKCNAVVTSATLLKSPKRLENELENYLSIVRMIFKNCSGGR